MKSLLELRIETVTPTFSARGQFKAIANAHGFDVGPIRLPGVRPGEFLPSAYFSAIRDAAGYWIGDPALLAHEETRKLVEEKISKGAVAICDVRLSSFDNFPGASFFEDLGIDATPIGAFATRYNKIYNHPRLIQLSRSEYPMAFRDSQLFRGVESLLIQQANGVGCSGYAQPALALPVEMLDIIDVRKDLFVDSFPKPELPVVAISSRGDWAGQVIAFSAGILHDPYTGPMGHHFPGIEAEDNRKLAVNLIRIVDRAARAAYETWEDAYRLIRSIEGDLTRITAMTMTSKYGARWFIDGVSEAIRLECEQRAAREGGKAPPQSYMDILHHKTVWKANWDLFRKLQSRGGEAISKEQGTKFFGRFNEIRRLAMHPTKQVFSDRPAPLREELRDLREYRDTVTDLLRAARNSFSSRGGMPNIGCPNAHG